MNAKCPNLIRLSLHATLFFAAAFAAPAPALAQDDEDFTPKTSAPPAVRTGGASRAASSEAGAATVTILAPAETIGLTTREQPVIYWSLTADTDKEIEVAINDPQNLENPLLETTLKGPTKAGVHKLDLAKLKQDGKPVKLQPGVKYDVVVELAANQGGASANPRATCRIMRVDPKDVPPDAAKEQDKAKLASVYGKQGIWFDYYDALSGAIDAKARDEALLQRRAKALATQRLVMQDDGTVTEEKGRSANTAKPQR